MKYKFEITGLDCPNCAAKLAKIIEDEDGVISAKINFLTEKLTVESELDADSVLDVIRVCAKNFDKNVKIGK